MVKILLVFHTNYSRPCERGILKMKMGSFTLVGCVCESYYGLLIAEAYFSQKREETSPRSLISSIKSINAIEKSIDESKNG